MIDTKSNNNMRVIINSNLLVFTLNTDLVSVRAISDVEKTGTRDVDLDLQQET